MHDRSSKLRGNTATMPVERDSANEAQAARPQSWLGSHTPPFWAMAGTERTPSFVSLNLGKLRSLPRRGVHSAKSDL